jgi:hypothetical protein
MIGEEEKVDGEVESRKRDGEMIGMRGTGYNKILTRRDEM